MPEESLPKRLGDVVGQWLDEIGDRGAVIGLAGRLVPEGVGRDQPVDIAGCGPGGDHRRAVLRDGVAPRIGGPDDRTRWRGLWPCGSGGVTARPGPGSAQRKRAGAIALPLRNPNPVSLDSVSSLFRVASA